MPLDLPHPSPLPGAPAPHKKSHAGPTPVACQCQLPMPAESTVILSASPAFSTMCRNTASAIGERQILPRHTNNTRTAKAISGAGNKTDRNHSPAFPEPVEGNRFRQAQPIEGVNGYLSRITGYYFSSTTTSPNAARFMRARFTRRPKVVWQLRKSWQKSVKLACKPHSVPAMAAATQAVIIYLGTPLLVFSGGLPGCQTERAAP